MAYKFIDDIRNNYSDNLRFICSLISKVDIERTNVFNDNSHPFDEEYFDALCDLYNDLTKNLVSKVLYQHNYQFCKDSSGDFDTYAYRFMGDPYHE